MELIRTDNVVKRQNHQFTLGPVSLSLRAGEVLGVIGDCGAGKTTLLKLIWGFLRPDAGRVSVFHLQPHLHQLSIRRHAGYLNKPPHFDTGMTARRHLQFAAGFYEGWDEATADLLLQRFGIGPEMCVSQLSENAKMKLALIAVAGHNPSLLLLDEPMTELGPEMRKEISIFLRAMAEERGTGIVVSGPGAIEMHNLVDSVLILNNGRIVESH